MNYFSSDFHFFHKRILLYCQERKIFLTTEEQDALFNAQVYSNKLMENFHLSEDTINKANKELMSDINNLYLYKPFMSDSEKLDFEKLNSLGFEAIKNIYISDESIEKMNNTIYSNMNNIINKNDILYFLGDFTFAKNVKQLKELRDRINCNNIIFILGNHDKKDLVEQVFTTYEQLEIEIDNIKVFMKHIPHLNKKWNNYCLFGHFHNGLNSMIEKSRNNEYLLDVGVDGNNFRPWSFEEIREKFSKKGDKHET